MCLLVNEKVAKVAEEEIVCYKIIVKDESGTFRTPFRGNLVEMNELLVEESFQFRSDGTDVHIGFHSFDSFESAIEQVDEDEDNYYIIQCVIPAGSRYWKGRFSSEVDDGYCSDRIIYKEETKKLVKKRYFFNLTEDDKGKSFRCKWRGNLIEGKVQFENYDLYLCQNQESGSSCGNKLGYKYSWVIKNQADKSHIEEFVLINDCVKTKTPLDITNEDHGKLFEAFYQDVKVEGRISCIEGEIHLCQNVRDGHRIDDTLGYQYSYIIQNSMHSDHWKEFKILDSFREKDVLKNSFEKLTIVKYLGDDIYIVSRDGDAIVYFGEELRRNGFVLSPS